MGRSGKYEWDDAKDAANRAKHGVSLARAADLDWTNALHIPQLRDGEARFLTYAPCGGRLHAVVWTYRNTSIMRIISLRKANNREIEKYEQETQEE